MDTPLRLGGRHALDAVRAGLELEPRVNVLPHDAADDFLVTAVLAGVLTDDLDPPALRLGITGVHPEQIARKDGGLVTPGTAANLEIDIAAVIGITWQHEALQLEFELLTAATGDAQFLLAHLTHVRITVPRHHAGRIDVIQLTAIVAKTPDNRAKFGELL